MHARALELRDIAQCDWDRCFPGEAEGYAYHALCAETPPHGFVCSALAVFDDELIAVAPMFRVDYRIDTSLQGRARAITNWVARWAPGLLTFRLLGMGSPLAERCHIGFAPCCDEARRRDAFVLLLDALETCARDLRIGLKAIKDMAEADVESFGLLLAARGFTATPSLPIAALDVPASETAYLARLSKATRKDVRRKLRASAAVTMEERADCSGLETEIAALYESTRLHSRVTYGDFEELPPDYFARVLAACPDRARLLLYRVEGELAAVNLLMFDDTRCIDKFLGMAYPLASDHNLYVVSWMTNVRLCIARGLSLLQSGQTAYGAKLRLGSRLAPSCIFFKHRNRITHALLQRLAPLLAFDRRDPELAAWRRASGRSR